MVIFLSGISSGIGRYLAQRLDAAGHSVIGISRTAATGSASGGIRSEVCDVAEWGQVSRLAVSLAGDETFARLDAIIHCAAIQGPAGPALAVDAQAWSECVRVNLDGTYFVLRAFVPLLRKNQGARAKVICFSGGGASQARPNFSAYAAAKTGVVRLVETLAEEWRAGGIDINAIAPGALPTRMTDEVVRAGESAAGESEVAGAKRTLDAGDAGFARMGDLVDFLLSAESDGISGRLLSAPWDQWSKLATVRERLRDSDIYTLRRITPADRGENWD